MQPHTVLAPPCHTATNAYNNVRRDNANSTFLEGRHLTCISHDLVRYRGECILNGLLKALTLPGAAPCLWRTGLATAALQLLGTSKHAYPSDRIEEFSWCLAAQAEQKHAPVRSRVLRTSGIQRFKF